ncbi:hypothetical protein D3C76_1427380 [compost metagenome]
MSVPRKEKARLPGASESNKTTGMPASTALLIVAVSSVGWMAEIAIPAGFLAMACSNTVICS